MNLDDVFRKKLENDLKMKKKRLIALKNKEDKICTR